MNRRSFLQATAAGLAASGAAATAAGFEESSPHVQDVQSARPAAHPERHALFVWGGWPGHQPAVFRDKMVPWLESAGFRVTVADTLDAYADPDLMATIDVVVQQWTMGEINREQAEGLLQAVREGGVGIAGWHGGLGDSFREHTEYQFMIGGQWVSHPGGKLDYTVRIVDQDDEITRGLEDFEIRGTEQYYMHVDPANHVLATTIFDGAHMPWIDGAVMPVVWKKQYGRGRVFYHSIGHNPEDLDVPEVLELTTRGILWAGRSRTSDPEHLVRPVYPASP